MVRIWHIEQGYVSNIIGKRMTSATTMTMTNKHTKMLRQKRNVKEICKNIGTTDTVNVKYSFAVLKGTEKIYATTANILKNIVLHPNHKKF